MPTETISDNFLGGRLNAPDPSQPRITLTTNLDFSTDSEYTFDLAIYNQKNVFGIPRAIFIDNTNNSNSLNVNVDITQQSFSVPPNSQGTFSLDCVDKSRITIKGKGTSNLVVRVSLYNWDKAPVVWYSYGATNPNMNKVQGTIAENASLNANSGQNNPVFVAGKDNLGRLVALNINSNGNLITSVNDALPAGANTIGSVNVVGSLPAGANTIGNVNISGSLPAGTNALGTVTLGTGTNTIGSVTGNVASGEADSGNPVKIGGVFNTEPPTLTTGQRGDTQMTSRAEMLVCISNDATQAAVGGSVDGLGSLNALTVRSYTHVFNGSTADRARGDLNGTVTQNSLTNSRWAYAAPTGGISNTTTAVTIQAAGGAGVRNYLTGLQISWSTLSAATELVIRDGAAGIVLWRILLPMVAGNMIVQLPQPLRGSVNTLMEVVTLTAVTGNIYVNAQGFTSTL